MTAVINSEVGKDYLVIDFTGEVAQGLQGNIANPEGCNLLITNSYMWLTTPSTAAATMNVGPGATGADNNELHGAMPLNGGAATAWMGYHPAVTQDAALAVLWGATEYLTFTTAAASAADCVAKFYIKYIRVE
jgi:hypothetical protein